MDAYIDLLLRADEEVPLYFIRNKIFAKFHKALFDLNQTSIGVSFPKYKVQLGNVFRIHGDQPSLAALQQTSWLGGLSGYCSVSPVQSVPSEVMYRTISRKQSNMTEAKLRRLIKRGSITPENINNYKAKMFQQGIDSPYVELQSSSNGHKHRRYLQFGELKSQSFSGAFDHFGLSKIATVPWF